MARRHTPGLFCRKGVWHIDKRILGRRLCESTGARTLQEAERYLAKRTEAIREAVLYGVRPTRTFREAATKYLLENTHKTTLNVDARNIKYLDTFIGCLPLESIHMGSLQEYLQSRKQQGLKARTVNHGLQIVRRILNLAASEWRDEFGFS